MKWVVLLLAAAAGVGLPGCTDGGGPATSSSTASGSSADLEGVVMEVVHTVSGNDHRLDATVRNTGLRAYYYLWVPQCGLEPWYDGMVGPAGSVQPREPTGHCHPCGIDVLSPGESLSKSFGWDERLWDLERERMHDAQPGRYVWTVRFEAEPDEDDVCGGERSLAVDTTVDVD